VPGPAPHDEAIVMTVLGPIRADHLGVTHTHEHVFVDLTCYWQRPAEATLQPVACGPVELRHLDQLRRNPWLNRDNLLLDDFDLAVEEVQEFARRGGNTLVDLSLRDIGRDVVALQGVSRLTGVHILAACGHYIARAHPPGLAEEAETSIAERMIRELSEGIDGTGVRAGIIGEIGTSDPVDPTEAKVLRAAARAQRETGIAITLHLTPPGQTGYTVLDILEGAGADPSRVVMGHLDPTIDDTLEYHMALARRGCFIQYDTCGLLADGQSYGAAGPCTFPSDRTRARAIRKLFDAGYGDQILIAHDICRKFDLLHYGGCGYGHILRTFVHYLREVGLGEHELRQLLVDNPRRMLVPQH
jgi:phosphotriesterase-related protein